MPVYTAIASSKPAEFEKVIKAKLDTNESFKIDEHTWLISPPSSVVTPKELCDFLEVSKGSAGRIIVLTVGTYYGYHNKEMWAWLTSKGA